MFSECLFLLGLAIELCKNFLLWRFLVRKKKLWILYSCCVALQGFWWTCDRRVVWVCCPPRKPQGQEVQTAFLPGLTRTPEHARFWYFWAGGEYSTPNTGIICSATEPGACLAWKSKYGLSRLLSSQIISGLSQSCDKITEETHWSDAFLLHSLWRKLFWSGTWLSPGWVLSDLGTRPWAGILAPASALAPGRPGPGAPWLRCPAAL